MHWSSDVKERNIIFFFIFASASIQILWSFCTLLIISLKLHLKLLCLSAKQKKMKLTCKWWQISLYSRVLIVALLSFLRNRRKKIIWRITISRNQESVNKLVSSAVSDFSILFITFALTFHYMLKHNIWIKKCDGYVMFITVVDRKCYMTFIINQKYRKKK